MTGKGEAELLSLERRGKIAGGETHLVLIRRDQYLCAHFFIFADIAIFKDLTGDLIQQRIWW